MYHIYYVLIPAACMLFIFIGYQIYFTYVRNRYLLFKTAENCYTQKLLTDNPKNPQPRHSMITYKRVKEMFPHMEQIEYKIGVAE